MTIRKSLLLGVATIAMDLLVGNATFSQLGPGPVAQVPMFTAIDLHPAGFTSSEALGISGGQQVGWGGGPYTRRCSTRAAVEWQRGERGGSQP